MKIIHFADTHFGLSIDGPVDRETGLPGRVRDFLDVFDSLIDFAEDEKADLFLFAGDMYHRHSPTTTLMREVSKRISRMTAICPVVMIPGNHDMTGNLDKASSISVLHALRVPKVTVLNTYGVADVEGIQVASFPAPFKRQLLTESEHRHASAEDTFRDRLADMLKIMEDDVDVNNPSVFLGHVSVDVATFGSERELSFGVSAELKVKDLSRGPWNYVALGHIHTHQIMEGRMPIVYSGSLERVNFGEEKDDKGFVLVGLNDDTTWEFIEVETRPMVTIYVDINSTRHPTDVVLKKIDKYDLNEAIVRLMLTMDSDAFIKLNMDAVYRKLKQAGAWYISAVNRYERVTMDRFRDGAVQPLTLMSRRDQLVEYFRSADIGGVKQVGLLKLAGDIMQEVDGD